MRNIDFARRRWNFDAFLILSSRNWFRRPLTFTDLRTRRSTVPHNVKRAMFKFVDCGGGNDPVPGACCYDDPDHGFVCVQMIEEFCLDAGGYWYGAGTLCTDPQVECDPIVSGCRTLSGC